MAAASVMTSPAPPTARLPKCTRCQSLAKPSSLEYSHMGETAIRFESVTPRIVRGVNRVATEIPLVAISRGWHRASESFRRIESGHLLVGWFPAVGAFVVALLFRQSERGALRMPTPALNPNPVRLDVKAVEGIVLASAPGGR